MSPVAEEVAEKEKTEIFLKSLPRNVDQTSARAILNEIVVHGDEVHWDDVAGLDAAKSALKEAVVYPFLRPDLFMGLREPARGMLLFGPPGTGKTMIARAVATESKSTFFSISASSLTSKFLGESEKLVRALFVVARHLAPSIIFVDEIDSLLGTRGGGSEHEATRRIKTEFLIQWSELQRAAQGSKAGGEAGDANRVLVLAATNLPWAIDEAARRRFVRRQYIPLPEAHVRRHQLDRLLGYQHHELSDEDLNRLVGMTEGKPSASTCTVINWLTCDLFAARLLGLGHHGARQGRSDGPPALPRRSAPQHDHGRHPPDPVPGLREEPDQHPAERGQGRAQEVRGLVEGVRREGRLKRIWVEKERKRKRERGGCDYDYENVVFYLRMKRDP